MMSFKISTLIYRSCVFWLTFFCHVLPLECQTTEALRSQIDKLIRHDTDISLQHVPGFIIGIIDRESSYVLPFGVRALNSTESLNANDVFELGSITKVMTAHIILKLYERHLIEIDHPLNQFLPIEYQNAEVKATIRDVLMHYSGLPKIPETIGNSQVDMDSPYSGFSKENLLSWYQSVKPVVPGEFRYSHAGYAMLELVIEQVTGEPYSMIFDRYLREAYGLQQTFASRRATLSPGYDLAGRKARSWSFQTFRGSEGAQSCLSDLMTYVGVLLDDSRTPLFWDAYRATHEKKLQVAPGWYRFLPKRDFPIYVHTGRTSGHSAMIAFSRKTKTAAIVLANSSAGTDDLGLLILRMINRQWRREN